MDKVAWLIPCRCYTPRTTDWVVPLDLPESISCPWLFTFIVIRGTHHVTFWLLKGPLGPERALSYPPSNPQGLVKVPMDGRNEWALNSQSAIMSLHFGLPSGVTRPPCLLSVACLLCWTLPHISPWWSLLVYLLVLRIIVPIIHLWRESA